MHLDTHTHTQKLTSRQARQLKPFNGDASSPLLCTWNERRARDNQPNRTLVFNYCGHFNWTEPIHAVTYINTHTHKSNGIACFRAHFSHTFSCVVLWSLSVSPFLAFVVVFCFKFGFSSSRFFGLHVGVPQWVHRRVSKCTMLIAFAWSTATPFRHV